MIGYVVGSLLFLSFSSDHVPYLYSLHIPLNCTDGGYELWQLEMDSPLVAFFIGAGDIFVCAVGILLIGLLKFINLAYQNDTFFGDVKKFLIKSAVFSTLIFALYLIPQFNMLSQILTPLFGVFLVILILKHRKRFFLILKWRCDDARIAQDGYAHHCRVRRNSQISFNIMIVGYIVLLCAMFLNVLSPLLSILFTDKSKYVTRTFNSDLSLAFLTCPNQQIIFQICSALGIVVPLTVLVGMIIYAFPLIAVSVGLVAYYSYHRCKSVESHYIRFEGNAHYFVAD